MDTVLALKGNVSVAKSTMSQVAWQLSPAFSDEACIQAFGKPYRDLSDRELEGIDTSLLKHYPTPLVLYALRVPFLTDRGSAKSREVWLTHIENANEVPLAVTLKTRTEEIARRERAAEQRKREEFDKKMAAQRPARPRLPAPRKDVSALGVWPEIDWMGGVQLLGELLVLSDKMHKMRLRQGLEQDKEWARDGGCKTWYELTDAGTVDRARRLYPYSFRYNFRGDKLFEILKNNPWNNAIRRKRRRGVCAFGVSYEIISKHGRSFPYVPINDPRWSDFKDAEKALSLIRKTPLCR